MWQQRCAKHILLTYAPLCTYVFVQLHPLQQRALVMLLLLRHGEHRLLATVAKLPSVFRSRTMTGFQGQKVLMGANTCTFFHLDVLRLLGNQREVSVG